MHRYLSALPLLLLLLLAAPCADAAESAPVVSPRATATLISDTDTVQPGQPYRLALRLRLAPGWHTYWRNPGDAGVAPDLTLTLPPGVTAGPISWPVPQRQREETLLTYGYDGEVVLPVTVSGGPGTITAVATWLVCEKLCVPEEGSFSLDLPPGTPGPAAQAALFTATDARMPRPAPWPARIAPDGVLRIDADGLGPDSVADAWFMPDVNDVIAASAPQVLRVSAGRVALALKPGSVFKPGGPLAGVLVLKDRAGGETALAVAAAAGPFEVDPPATPGLLHLLALAFIGGLILNLMPCVFPVLAMKAMALTRLAGQARSDGRKHAAAYATGVVATLLAVAFGLLAVRAAGGAAGWGFQFQSPVFVAAMALVLFAVGLNLSGVFAFGGSVGVGQSLAGRHGMAGSFFSGMLAVLVATPCTAPFMSVALTAGLAGSTGVTLGVFAALGAGLAAPYVLLAFVPQLICSVLPKPGHWMDVLKQAFAFPMYGGAIWLVWVLSIESGPPGVLAALVAIGLVAVAGWLIGLTQRGTLAERSTGHRWVKLAAALCVLAALGAVAGLTVAEGPPALAGASPDGGAEAFSPARLAELRAAGKPVFVNMTAAWCVSCLVNERIALSRAPVQAAFAQGGIVYLKGDWTRQDPAITAYLRANGAVGVPLYVFYPAGNKPALILPQILTPSIVLDAIGAV